jgi:hypothetical protein
MEELTFVDSVVTKDEGASKNIRSSIKRKQTDLMFILTK